MRLALISMFVIPLALGCGDMASQKLNDTNAEAADADGNPNQNDDADEGVDTAADTDGGQEDGEPDADDANDADGANDADVDDGTSTDDDVDSDGGTTDGDSAEPITDDDSDSDGGLDAGGDEDGGPASDSGMLPVDSGSPSDSGTSPVDSGSSSDSASPSDSGLDSGSSSDVGAGEITGCTDVLACNYDPLAVLDDGSCTFPASGYDCDSSCVVTVDCLGVCGGVAIIDECGVCDGPGITHTCWDASTVCAPEDCSPKPGCTDATACNFDATAETDDGSCTFPADGFDCADTCITDIDCAGTCGGTAALDACGVCDGPGTTHTCWDASTVCAPEDCSPKPGCTDATACNFDATAETDDGSCTFPADGFDCADTCITDIDCAGTCGGTAALDACGVCDGPGTTHTCWDDSSVCTPADCSPKPGCTDATACNFDATAETDDGSCTLPADGFDCAGTCMVDTDCAGTCGGTAALDACGVCEGPGTTHTCWDGSSVCAPADCSPKPGCTDATACNFDATAETDDGSCTLPADGFDCAGTCIVGTDCFGVCGGTAVVDDCGECGGPGKDYICWDDSTTCDPSLCAPEPIPGCMDASACNYDGTATVDDGSCTFAAAGFDCAGTCIVSTDCTGLCGGSAVVDDCGTCGGPGPTHTCWDGTVVCNASDCSVPGCTTPSACNYDASATVDDGSCVSAAYPFDCDGECVALIDCKGTCGGSASYDECGVCDGSGAIDTCWDGSTVCDVSSCPDEPVPGCTDSSACNYDASATTDDGSCYSASYPFDCFGSCIPGYDCAGTCGGSASYDACGTCGGSGPSYSCWDGSSVCDPSSCSAEPVYGCTDAGACNYDASATADDGSCYSASYPFDCAGSCIPGYDCAGSCGGSASYDACGTCGGSGPSHTCWDGSSVCSPSSCSPEPVYGCTDAGACNYDSSATADDGSCYSASYPLDCDGNCVLAVDCAGTCGGSATTDCAGTCGGSATTDSCGVCGGGGPSTCWDGSSVCPGSSCPAEPVYGCTSGSACNYSPSATHDDGSCTYATYPYDCSGTCIGHRDCAGICGGDTVIDECGVCGGVGPIDFCIHLPDPVCDISECVGGGGGGGGSGGFSFL